MESRSEPASSNPWPHWPVRLPADPRLLQILFLGSLLAAGAWFRDFSIRREQIVLTFLAAVGCQAICDRARGSSAINYRSALITGLSLTLLLRADSLWPHPIAAATAIGSKFIFRFRGKHLFNPGNLGVIAALLVLPGTWISAGQWGQDIALSGWLTALGFVVANRARRSDVSLSFLGFHLGALALRVIWLGQRWAVWTHQLGNGGLLLFAFFMISDPMTAPNHPRGRIAHAALVTAIAYAWQFSLYRTNALLWALFIASFAVPVWDAIFPASKYEWVVRGGNDETKIDENSRMSGPDSRGVSAAVRHAA